MTINNNQYDEQSLTSKTTDDHIACVQYGIADGPVREPKLRRISDPVPNGAITASPIYLLTRDQWERQQQLDSGYAISGSETSIATELQNECEADDRVLYPVHIESDALWEVGGDCLIEWFQQFISQHLDVSFDDCTLYFSGNRSIHVHIPRVLRTEAARQRFKSLAEQFCTATEAELDCGLYDAKRMFRLPGVEHQKSGTPKLEIDRWNNEQLARRVDDATAEPPETYADVLEHVFTLDSSQLNTSRPSIQTLKSDEAVLSPEWNERWIDTPLVEREQCPTDSSDILQWVKYNAKEFSPYAHAEDGSRSVAVLRIKEGEFCRANKRSGATMIPAWFFAAVGCNGEYTKYEEHAPLQLSEQDYEGWEYRPGRIVTVIGGRSRNSRVFDISRHEATVLQHILMNDETGREEALGYLETEGYDTGSGGSKSTGTTRPTAPSKANSEGIWPARQDPRTEAEALQLKAEQGCVEDDLSHQERIKVACRHLQYGWTATWDWFKDQYGAEFDPEITHQFLSDLVDSLDGYDHVEVPPTM